MSYKNHNKKTQGNSLECAVQTGKNFFVKSDTWIHSTWLTQQLIKGNGQMKSKMSLCRWETSWPVSWENKPYRFPQTCNYVYIQPPSFYTHFILAQQKLSQFFSYFKTAMYRRDHSMWPVGDQIDRDFTVFCWIFFTIHALWQLMYVVLQ